MTVIAMPRNLRDVAVGEYEEQERSADLAYGQIVVISARWVLIATGLILALWSPVDATELRVQIGVLLLLAVANFYLHAQLLTHRPVIDLVAYATSAADLLVITLLIATQGGIASSLYIFYFPAILALSVAFPTVLTVGYTAAAIVMYGLVCELSIGVSGILNDQARDVLARAAMLAATAYCGNTYFRIEQTRRRSARAAQRALERELDIPAGGALPAALEAARTLEHEAAEDLFFGQVVTIWARWFLVGTAVVLMLWSAGTVEEITAQVPIAIVLMAVNFVLHGRYLMSRPANRLLVLLSSIADIALVTAAVLILRPGLESRYFVFYYPVLAALAFVFPPRTAFMVMAGALAAYGLASFAVAPGEIVASAFSQKLLVNRLITLAATGALATYYWRIQRDRRRQALGLETTALGSVEAVRLGLAGEPGGDEASGERGAGEQAPTQRAA